MILAIIIILVLYLTFHVGKMEYKSNLGVWGTIGSTFLAFCFTSFGGFILMLLVCLFSTSYWPEKNRIDYQKEIVSLRNESGVNGQFFLGSGSIGNSEYYYTFVKNDNGGLKRWRISSNRAYLYMDSDKPYVFWQKVRYIAPKWLSFIEFERFQKTLYDIHVPSGTVIEEYKIN